MANFTRRRFLGSMGGAVVLGATGAAFAADSAAASRPVTENEPETKPVPALNSSDLHVAFIQIDSEGTDQEANLKKAEQYFRWAAERGADIALLPEMFNIGYNGFGEGGPEVVSQWQAQAVARNSPWVQHFAKLAKELNMALGVTYLEKWSGPPRNTLTLFDRHGHEALTYAKVHTCDFAGFEAATTPGEEFYVSELDTAKGTVRTGAMICFDREFPEAARLLMLKGAELVLVPNACLLDDLRIAQFRVRAHENAVMMAMTNYPEPKPFMNGRSVAFDVAGNPIQEAPAGPGIYSAPFDLAAMRAYRENTIWGNAWRRPHRYEGLTTFQDLPEFRRTDGLGRPFIPGKR